MVDTSFMSSLWIVHIKFGKNAIFEYKMTPLYTQFLGKCLYEFGHNYGASQAFPDEFDKILMLYSAKYGSLS
jgi:hypothetical protein